MIESAPALLLLLLAKDETLLLDTTIWLDVRFDALVNMVLLEFKMLLVSLRAFETRSFILSFRLPTKSFVMSPIELASTAKTFPNDGIIIDNTTSINIMPCKIATKIAIHLVISLIIPLFGSPFLEAFRKDIA
jgi:hypothetical protein